MKRLLLLLALIPGFAWAQVGVSFRVAEAARQAAARVGAPTTPPTEQGGQLPAPSGRVPQELVINADIMRQEGVRYYGEGNVHFTYKGYEVWADKLIGDTATNIFVVEGNVILRGETEDVTGEMVQINFDNNSFIYHDGTARLAPDWLEKKVSGDIYVRSQEGEGTPDRFHIHNGSITTCEYDDPHYELVIDASDIIPGRRAKLRNVRVKILGNTVVTIPYLVVPLTEDADRYLPEVGQSPDEGYYIKSKFSVPFKRENYMDVRVDLMQKLGVGLGGDAFFFDPDTRGRISGYWLFGTQPSQRYAADLEQRIGRGQLTINSTFQVDDYLTAPQATLWNLRSQYVLPWGNGTTRLSAFRSSSDRGTFNSLSQVYSLSDSREFGTGASRLRTRIDANYNINESTPNMGTPTKSERIDVRFQATKDFKTVTADLLYQRSIPVGDTIGFFGSSDRTPMFTLSSDSDRIFGERAPNTKVQVEGSIGELIDPTKKEPVTRVFFDARSGDRHDLSKSLQLTWNARFRQGLYSDDTAQYAVAYVTRLSWNFAEQSSINVNYRRIKSVGFTPLSIDRTGQADALTLDYTHRLSRQLAVTAYTGYDILLGDKGLTPWQQVSVGATYTPNDDVRLQTNAVYDTFSELWSTIRTDLQMRWGQTYITASARYDGRREQFAGGNISVSGLRFGRLSTSFMLDYNGYTSQFDAAHFQFVYDLHCAEAVLEIIENNIGFRSGRSIAFFVRIKALPGGGPFGIGTRGQSIGSGSGFGF